MIDGTGSQPPHGGPPPLLSKRETALEEAVATVEHERRPQGILPICPKPVKIDTRNLEMFQRYFASTSSTVQGRGENKMYPPLLPLTPPCSPTKNQLSSKLFTPPQHSKQRPPLFYSSAATPFSNSNGQGLSPRKSTTKIFFPGKRQGSRCSRSHHHEHRNGAHRAHRHSSRDRESLELMRVGHMLPTCRQPNLVVTRGSSEVIVIPDSPPVFPKPAPATKDIDQAKTESTPSNNSETLHHSTNMVRRAVSHDEAVVNGHRYQTVDLHRSMSADCATIVEGCMSSPQGSSIETEATTKDHPPSHKRPKQDTTPNPEESLPKTTAKDIKDVYEKEFPAIWLAEKALESHEAISVSRDVEKIQQKIAKVDNARSSLIELQEIIFARCEEPCLEEFEDKVNGFGMRLFLSQIRSLIEYYDSQLRLLKFYLSSPPAPSQPSNPSTEDSKIDEEPRSS